MTKTNDKITTKQHILRYLDKLCREIPITAKRISRCSNMRKVLDIGYVKNVMKELVESGEWEIIKCYSARENVAYVRVKKDVE